VRLRESDDNILVVLFRRAATHSRMAAAAAAVGNGGSTGREEFGLRANVAKPAASSDWFAKYWGPSYPFGKVRNPPAESPEIG